MPQKTPIWGKTNQKTNDPSQWLPLDTHLIDVANTSELIWNQWAPLNVKSSLDNELNGNGKETLAFLASIHDVGKASPIFENQAPDSYSFILKKQQENGLHINNSIKELPRQSRPKEYRHEKISAITLYDWLLEKKHPEGNSGNLRTNPRRPPRRLPRLWGARRPGEAFGF